MAIRVFIVADHDLLRQGVRAALRHPDIDVVGDVKECRNASDSLLALSPDVVLLETTISNGLGAFATRTIKQRCPQTRVLILAPNTDQEHFREAMAAGASGYELTNISPTHLVNAIRAIHRGETAINQAVIKRMVASFAADGQASPSVNGKPRGPSRLTAREVEILSSVAKGMSDKEIAAKLFLCEATVKSHLRSIYTKLNIRNRAQATALAVTHGLIAPQ